MKIKFYNFEDFEIQHIKDGWYDINSKQLGSYLYNIDSVEIAKIPANISSDYKQNIIKRTIAEKEVKPTKTYNPENFFKNGKVPRLMIFPTSSCNLNCIYCHCESEKESSHMKDSILLETISKYIQYVDNYGNLNEGIEITFMGGGEPFVKFENIKKIVSLLKEKRIKAQFIIVTNGTLGTDDDWLWLKREKFRITISADGPPLIQNYQRPFSSKKLSSQIIEKRLNFLTEHKIKVNIRSTIINSKEENIDNICKYFRGFKCVKTHHLEPVSFAGRGEMLHEDNFNKFYFNFFTNYSKYLYSNPSRYKSAWFKPFQKSDGFCGAVYHNSIVTHDGYVTLCTEVDSKSLNSDIGKNFIVAKIDDENPFGSLKAIEFTKKNSIYKLSYCNKCIIKYKCGGGCYIKRLRDFSNDHISFYNAFCKNIIALHLSYLLQIYEKKLNNQHKTV